VLVVVLATLALLAGASGWTARLRVIGGATGVSV
jgi:hypothetical protein